MSVAPESSQDSNDQPTQPLVSAGNSDRCSVCGAQLAVDQRYCVECGTRRGAPRFSLVSQSAAPAAAAATRSTTTISGPGRFLRPTSSSVLLAGLLVLLVALGVGVLIGHNGRNTPVKQGAVNVTVAGGTAAPASANTGTPSVSVNPGSSSGSTKSSTTKKSTSKSSSGAGSSGTTSGANASASGKTGNAAAASKFSKTATKKSTLGGGCTAGTAGCQNGQQTGNLF